MLDHSISRLEIQDGCRHGCFWGNGDCGFLTVTCYFQVRPMQWLNWLAKLNVQMSTDIFSVLNCGCTYTFRIKVESVWTKLHCVAPQQAEMYRQKRTNSYVPQSIKVFFFLIEHFADGLDCQDGPQDPISPQRGETSPMKPIVAVDPWAT